MACVATASRLMTVFFRLSFFMALSLSAQLWCIPSAIERTAQAREPLSAEQDEKRDSRVPSHRVASHAADQQLEGRCPRNPSARQPRPDLSL